MFKIFQKLNASREKRKEKTNFEFDLNFIINELLLLITTHILKFSFNYFGDLNSLGSKGKTKMNR